MGRLLAGVGLVLVLLSVGASARTWPGPATDVAVSRLETRPHLETREYDCKRDAYVTGDLVGDGNPAEVYARLCP